MVTKKKTLSLKKVKSRRKTSKSTRKSKNLKRHGKRNMRGGYNDYESENDNSAKKLSKNISNVIYELRKKLKNREPMTGGRQWPLYGNCTEPPFANRNIHFGGYHKSKYLKKSRW